MMNRVNNKKNGDVSQEKTLGHNSEIGKKLRAFYTAIQDETIPERFLELLNALDSAEEASQKSADMKSKDPGENKES